MIKYHYDDEKKQRFLSFWGLKDINEWDAVSKKPIGIFLKIINLRSDLKKSISLLLEQDILERKAKTVKGKIAFTEGISKTRSDFMNKKVDSKLMEELDALNFITYSKNNPLNRNDSNKWHWNEWMASFWKGLDVFFDLSAALEHYLDTHPASGFSIKSNEQKNLANIFEAFVFNEFPFKPTEKDLASLKALYAKKIIFFFICHKDAINASVIVNPHFLTFKESRFLVNDLVKESSLAFTPLGKLVLYLDKMLFEKKTKGKLSPLEIKLKEEQSEFLDRLAKVILSGEGMQKYLASDFEQKIDFITNIANEDNEFLLREMLLFENQFPLNKGNFVFLLKRIFYENANVKITLEKIESLIKELNFLGIIYQKGVFFHLNEAYCELKKRKNLRRPKVMIDIDMSITIFKKELNEELNYYLSTFTKRNTHTYSVHFELDVRLSRFAWFLNFNHQKIVHLLKKHGAESLSREFEEYLKLFFENCDFHKEKKLHSLLIPSTIEYNKLKFYLMNEKLSYETIFNDQKKIVVFLKQEDYQTFLEENKVEKTFKIF